MKTKSIITLLLLTAFLTACDDSASTGGGGSTTYAIGDTGPGGGIVFYTTDGGKHGMEASSSNLSDSHIWSTITNAYADGVSPLPDTFGTGQSNTDTIIAQDNTVASAAKLCKDYRSGGKNDWYLPSLDEAKEVYKYRNMVGMDENWYWTSSEDTYLKGEATIYCFIDHPATTTRMKDGNCRVRAIRNF